MTHDERNLEMIRKLQEHIANYKFTQEHIDAFKKRQAEDEAKFEECRITEKEFLDKTYSI